MLVVLIREILDQPILGYNVIEEVIKGHEIPNPDIQSLAETFTNLKPGQVESLVNLIRTPSQEELCNVRTIKQDTVIARETSIRVKCGANTGPVSERIHVLLERSDDKQVWPSDLQIHKETTRIPTGSSFHIQVNVSNNTKHDIMLNKQTVVGTLKSITPHEVRLKQSRKLD